MRPASTLRGPARDKSRRPINAKNSLFRITGCARGCDRSGGRGAGEGSGGRWVKSIDSNRRLQ